jgi:hypothetical protein
MCEIKNCHSSPFAWGANKKEVDVNAIIFDEAQEWAIAYVYKDRHWEANSYFIVHAKSHNSAVEYFQEIQPDTIVRYCKYYGPVLYL